MKMNEAEAYWKDKYKKLKSKQAKYKELMDTFESLGPEIDRITNQQNCLLSKLEEPKKILTLEIGAQNNFSIISDPPSPKRVNFNIDNQISNSNFNFNLNTNVNTDLNSNVNTNLNLNNNAFFWKKIEELETNYNSLREGFSIIIHKYKSLKEENDLLNNTVVVSQNKEIQNLREYNTKIYRDLENLNKERAKLLEVQKSLAEITYFNYSRKEVAKIYPSETQTNNVINQQDENDKYCEPMPSLLRFLNHKVS
jgi:hypothetical protein